MSGAVLVIAGEYDCCEVMVCGTVDCVDDGGGEGGISASPGVVFIYFLECMLAIQ